MKRLPLLLWALWGCLVPALATEKSDTVLLRQYLERLTRTAVPNSYSHPEQLELTATFIFDRFSAYADTVYYQFFQAEGTTYRNVIAVFGPRYVERIVVGAHYDVCGEQAGADDNASGVAGLLELARLFHGSRPGKRIELVAYCLEEPPYFRSQHMGSFHHAQLLHDSSAHVLGMLSLEMIGYFLDEKHTQRYPVGILSLFYGTRGNYITLVKKWGAGKFSRQFARRFKATRYIRTKKFAAPACVPGIDYSDHLNYWHFGYSALMITDTSFYRNEHYHTTGDTIEKLDFKRMAAVIDATAAALLRL